jgi:hypothetical protein
MLKCFLVFGVAKDKRSVRMRGDGAFRYDTRVPKREVNAYISVRFPVYVAPLNTYGHSAQYIFRCVGLHYLRHGRSRR